MPLPPPNFVPVSRLQAAPIRHAWNDWDPVEDIGEHDENLELALSTVRPDAILGLVIACSEWVLYRMVKRTDARRLQDYIDAAWVRLSRGEPIQYWPEMNQNCDGPIRGPLGVVAASIWNAFQGAPDGDLSAAVVMVRLARLVMIDPGPFDQWFHLIVPRLQQMYPKSDAETPPPIREVYDPEILVTPENHDILAESLEAFVDSQPNEFLQEPPDDPEEDSEESDS